MKKLLVAIYPGYDHTPAIERVGAIAQHLDVEIMLYSAVYDAYYASLRYDDTGVKQASREQMIATERKILEGVKADLQPITKRVFVDVEWCAPPSDGIIASADLFGADLILISSKPHNAIARWILNNTDWDVLRQSTIPVLLCHHHPFKPYTTVLAAVDPTHVHDEPAELDVKIVEQGKWLANLFDGDTHLAHAYRSARTVISADIFSTEKMTKQWFKLHSNAVKQLAVTQGIDDAHIHLLDEIPNQAIPAIANQLSADLVVMGSVSRGIVDSLMIGLTTERVLDHLECDVLTVRISRPD